MTRFVAVIPSNPVYRGLSRHVQNFLKEEIRKRTAESEEEPGILAFVIAISHTKEIMRRVNEVPEVGDPWVLIHKAALEGAEELSKSDDAETPGEKAVIEALRALSTWRPEEKKETP